MSQQYSIKFPFSVLVPEEIASTAPDFSADQWDPEGVLSTTGQNVFVKLEFQTALETLFFSDEDKYSYVRFAIDDIEVSLTQDGTVMSTSVMFDDSVDPTPLFALFDTFEITHTLITS